MIPSLIGLAVGLVCGVGLAFLVPANARTKRSRRRGGVLRRLEGVLAEAGWAEAHPLGILAAWAGAAALAGVLVAVLVPIPVLAPLAALAVLGAGRGLIRARIDSRRRRLRQTWPGLIDHLRSAVRSGAGVSDAVVYLVDRVPEEMRPAFQHFHEALDHGSSVDQALRSVKAELADPVGDRVIEALRLAHDVGGSDLPVVLDSLQHSVRADIAVREDARAKQAWIRAASRLGVAAPWLVLIVLSGRDETVEAYSSATGVGLVLAGALVSTLAFRAMATLGSLPSQRRWFAAEPARVGA